MVTTMNIKQQPRLLLESRVVLEDAQQTAEQWIKDITEYRNGHFDHLQTRLLTDDLLRLAELQVCFMRYIIDTFDKDRWGKN